MSSEISQEELDAQMARRSRSFDAWALDYDTYRPTYPQQLFDHIAASLELPERPEVADLGAGTGKAARQMARRGWRVTAVEPGGGMLDVLRMRATSEHLAIEARQAPAEDTGLPDASVDLVTAAQAFHWFDKAPAVAEMARITRPGGGVAVFWNTRADERSEFLAENTRLIELYVPAEHIDKQKAEDEYTTRADLAEGGFFVVDDRVDIAHELTMTSDAYVGYIFSASQVRLFVDDENKARLRSDLTELISRFFPDGKVVVPYDVELYVAKRTAEGADSG